MDLKSLTNKQFIYETSKILIMHNTLIEVDVDGLDEIIRESTAKIEIYFAERVRRLATDPKYKDELEQFMAEYTIPEPIQIR